jgi:CDP-diacylglycerol--glycerol-3-phosphate 3-phosphatidyltransferase
MRLTYANILTLSRFFLSPIFLAFAVAGKPWSMLIAAIVFVVAALTDWADGHLARTYGQVTPQGVYLDPLADKVLTTSAFVAFYILNLMPLWMVIVIVVRDFGTTALRNIAQEKGTAVKTSRLAKIKTALQMVIICLVIGLQLLSVFITSINATQITWWMLFLLTMYTIYTGIDYIVRYRTLFRRKHAPAP